MTHKGKNRKTSRAAGSSSLLKERPISVRAALEGSKDWFSSPLKIHIARAALLALIIFLVSVLPLRTAFEFGKDEGYETMKAFLHSQGSKLYTEVWDDQPPLFTILLSTAFRAFGSTIFVARIVAAGFATILTFSLFELVRRAHGTAAGFVSCLLLLASPLYLTLAVSVMQEIPCYALAVASLLCLAFWGNQKSFGWIMASGILMGLALQIKFTAALVIPAALLEIFAVSPNTVPAGDLRTRARGCLAPFCIWGAAAICIFLSIALIWGKGSFALSWKTHALGHAVSGLGGPDDAKFDWDMVAKHWEGIVAAILTIMLYARKKKISTLRTPLSLLVTALLVHSIHRPWWNYYYLHLGVPLAWLGSLAVAPALAYGLRQHNRSALGRRLVAGSLALLILAVSERRIENTIRALRSTENLNKNEIVVKLRGRANSSSWIYASTVIYAFHAQCRVLPELAVVSFKRFWSGQLTPDDIVNICRDRRPDFILLPAGNLSPSWANLIEGHYAEVGSDASHALYCRME